MDQVFVIGPVREVRKAEAIIRGKFDVYWLGSEVESTFLESSTFAVT